jgi:hypothetical protein
MIGETGIGTAATIGEETTVVEDTPGVTMTEIAGSINGIGTGIRTGGSIVIGGTTDMAETTEIGAVGVSSRTGHHGRTLRRRGSPRVRNQSLRRCRLGWASR